MLVNGKKAINAQHPFHIVSPSHLPIIVSILIGLIADMTAYLLHNPVSHSSCPYVSYIAFGFTPDFYVLSGTFILLINFLTIWFWDIIVEARIGWHTIRVAKGLKLGMVLFIASEIMFFFSFFWAFFHVSIAPAVGIGCVWPPVGIDTLNPWHLPLANTIILLSSGVCTVWAHRAILAGLTLDAATGLFLACLYGILFSWLQFIEYGLANFSINDSVYGSIFYMATGFHGVHVIVGTIMLLVAYFRLLAGHFSTDMHIGFEVASWYWHFVDVVWLFLYVFVYCWGS